MDEVVSRGVAGPALPLESLDPVVDEVLAFIIVASVAEEAREDLITEAIRIFDNVILPAVKDSLEEAALYFIDYTGLDTVELVDCLGGDPLSEVVSWAANTLTGHALERPESVARYAKCTGISGDLLDAEDTILASAVMYSFIASINKMIQNLLV